MGRRVADARRGARRGRGGRRGARPGTNLAELADLEFTGDARAAANDLSLADGRFAPDILEVAARRVVQAWVEAVDGSDARLERVADPEAVRALLHPDGPQTRLVVRGLEIRQIRITGARRGGRAARR